jgi:hypothetical protein
LFACLAAFCVSRSTNLDAGADVIDFDSQCFEHDEQSSGFNLTTDTFTPRVSGLYWLHFTAGLPDTGELTEVQLVLPTRTINIVRSAPGMPATSSRSELVYLTADVDQLHLSSADVIWSTASNAQVSWSGIHLESIMNGPVVAFSAALSKPTERNGEVQVAFDTILVDTHSGWNVDRYNVPVAGLWVVTAQVGDHPNTSGGSSFHVNLVAFECYVDHWWPGRGVDQDSCTAIVHLDTDDYLALTVRDTSAYSDLGYQTSLMGFLYSPSAFTPVAWTVILATTRLGPVDPLPFRIVFMNEGNGFNGNSSNFITPQAGLYYVSMTGSSIHDEHPMRLELLHNGVLKATVAFEFFAYLSRTRAIILRLNVGDELRVRLPANYEVYASGAYAETLFCGFRMSP